MDPQVNSNSSRNLTADGLNVNPSTYEFVYIKMTNREFETKNITSLVTSLVIVEDLYSPIVTARLEIRDNVNFFEDFKLNGQEIVEIKVRHIKNISHSNKSYTDATLTLVVKDYPSFEKTGESINVQEYSINLVSPFAYLSRLQQISRSVSGDPITAIKNIFKRDLGYPYFDDEKNTYPCITSFKGVITQRTPLQAIQWLQSKCYDLNKTPFFVYSTLKDGKIVMRSWSSIIDEKNQTYPDRDSQYFLKPAAVSKPGTEEYFKQQSLKIISINSNIKLDKLGQAVTGGFGQTVKLIDFENRTYTEEKSKTQGVTLKDKKPLSIAEGISKIFQNGIFTSSVARSLPNRGAKTAQTLAGQDLSFQYLEKLGIDANKFIDDLTASTQLFYLPLSPYGEVKSPAQVTHEALSETMYYLSNLESVSHEIVVYGNFEHCPATKIQIAVPKACNPAKNGSDELLDHSLSGTYVIGLSVHNFSNGVYTNRLKLIKDKSGR